MPDKRGEVCVIDLYDKIHSETPDFGDLSEASSIFFRVARRTTIRTPFVSLFSSDVCVPLLFLNASLGTLRVPATREPLRRSRTQEIKISSKKLSRTSIIT